MKTYIATMKIKDLHGNRLNVAEAVGQVVHCPEHDDHHPSAVVFEDSDRNPAIHCHACHETWKLKDA